jgi:hypothetical protein
MGGKLEMRKGKIVSIKNSVIKGKTFSKMNLSPYKVHLN